MIFTSFRIWRYLFLTPLLSLVGLGVLWGLGLISFMISIAVMSPTPLSVKADGIVVLTGGADRVATGIELLQKRAGKELLISGVYPGTRLADLAAQSGIDPRKIPCCVTLGFQATNTSSNARETALWVKDRHITRLRLVTANYHMPRAWLEMRNIIPDVQIIPHPVKSRRFALWSPDGVRLVLKEYHKTILVAARRWVQDGRRALSSYTGTFP